MKVKVRAGFVVHLPGGGIHFEGEVLDLPPEAVEAIAHQVEEIPEPSRKKGAGDAAVQG